MEKNIWGIHTTDDKLFLSGNVIALGWKDIGDLSGLANDRETFKAKYQSTYPDSKLKSTSLSAGMLYRFLYEVKIDDYIIYPSKVDKRIHIGIITGKYYFDSFEKEYVHKRSVKWLKSVPRVDFSQGALYEVGSAMTLFSIKSYADEFLFVLENKNINNLASETEDDDTISAVAEDIKQTTYDYILKVLSKNFKGYPLEELVADLLQSMGYRATVSKQGGDHGIDIIAYKDELPPRITIQVKSQDAAVKEETIQSLKGAMVPGDYGLFVSLSGYQKNAKRFLERNPMIRGIDGEELAGLILKYYDLLPEKYQSLLSLQKVYIPTIK